MNPLIKLLIGIGLCTATALGQEGKAPPPNPVKEALAEAVRTADPKAAPAPTGPPRPASLPPGAPKWIYAQAASRAIHATVYSASLRDSYGDLKAADGRAMLVVDVELENIIPLTLIYEKQVPTEYRVPNLADHVYLVLDGVRLARLHPNADALPGHVKVKDFKLERFGSRTRGNLVFDAGPMAEAKTVEMRYYDYAHGHFALKMTGTDEAFANQNLKPVQPPLKNEVVEAGVFALKKLPELNGTPAPEGMTYVVADLRARSMFTFPGDATAFDPKAKPGAKMQIGTVADWTDAHRYLQLVVDGERAYMPAETGTTLPEAPRFLPDVMTGGTVIFLAPADAKSLELRSDFPNAKPPGGGANFRPKGLTLALEGKRPPLSPPNAIASVDDDVYKVTVSGQSAANTFAGVKAPQGKRYLVLDVVVSNVGKQGELFQTKEQLKLTTSDGTQLEIDPATYQGKYRPTELVFIPPGERRTFQVAYAIPADETKPRLAYGGISLAKTLDLQPIEGATAVAAANPAPAPAEKPDAPAKPEPDKPQAAAPAKNAQVAVNVPAKPPGKVEWRPKAGKRPKTEEEIPRVPVGQPHEPKGIAGVGLKAEQVNAAIDRGAEFLWKHIAENDVRSNNPFGNQPEHGISALALVHAGYHKKDPSFDAALRRWLSSHDPLSEPRTYQMGVYCMLLQSYGDPTYLPQLRRATQWLLDTQGPEGTWGYGIVIKKDDEGPPVRRVLQVAGGRPLSEPPGGAPMVRTTAWEKGGDGDNSVTQYALLGLHAATRMGIDIPAEVWQRALDEHRKRQGRDGGWNYTSAGWDDTYGSMTCAGLCALALSRHALGEAEPGNDRDIEQGMAWLDTNFTVEGNPYRSEPEPAEDWHYYYLYSLERVGRILGTEFFGKHEWYPLGTKYLLSKQLPDGGWFSKGDHNEERLATSFALLFLTRATESLDLPKREGPGTLKTAVVTPPGQKVYIILDGSGTMLEQNNGVPRFEVARRAMQRLTNELAKTSEVGLRVFGHRKAAIEKGADEDTELLAPMSREGRETAIAALQSLRPRGKTPLARTLIEAAGDVRGQGTPDDPVTVLLVTDGGEDNTRPPKPPLEAAKELGAIEGVRWFVIGFDVNRPEWVQQLDGLARSGNGQYLSAEDEGSLHREMRAAILGTPESFAVYDEKGRPVKTGTFGADVPLPEGKYTFRTSFGGREFEESLWINAGSTTAVSFDAAAVAAAVAAGQGTPAPAATPAVSSPPAQPDAPAPARKFCTSCGNALIAAARFCTKCGAAVK